jgi:hypothetical protein
VKEVKKTVVLRKFFFIFWVLASITRDRERGRS